MSVTIHTQPPPPPTVGDHTTPINPKAKMLDMALFVLHFAGLDPRRIIKKNCKDWLPHFDANNVFITLKLRDLHYL